MALRSEAGPCEASGTAGIELFTTSTASDVKTKKDCYRLRALLEAKRVPFIEVDLAVELWRRRQMIADGGGDALPQLHANGTFIGNLEEVQELEDYGELDAIISAACGRAQNGNGIEASGDMLSDLLTAHDGSMDASEDEDEAEESNFGSEESSSSRFSESGSSESSLAGINSSGSLEQLASREEDGSQESHTSKDMQHGRAKGNLEATLVGEALSEPASPSSLDHNAAFAAGSTEGLPSGEERPGSQAPGAEEEGATLRGEKSGPLDSAGDGEEGKPSLDSEAASEGDGLEEHLRLLGAALAAESSDERVMPSTAAPPTMEVLIPQGESTGAFPEIAEGNAINPSSVDDMREPSAGEASPADDELGIVDPLSQSQDAEREGAGGYGGVRPPIGGVGDLETGLGSSAKPLVAQNDVEGVGAVWLVEHFDEMNLDASCHSLLPGMGMEDSRGLEGTEDELPVPFQGHADAVDTDAEASQESLSHDPEAGMEAGGSLRGAGDEQGHAGEVDEGATRQSPSESLSNVGMEEGGNATDAGHDSGTELPGSQEKGPRGHPFCFSEDDFSPVKRAIDPIWDDATDESSTGRSPQKSSSGGGLSGLASTLPAVSPALSEVLPGEDAGGVFTLDETEGEESDAASLQLQEMGQDLPIAASIRRVSCGVVRGTERYEGVREQIPRRASEPVPGNSGRSSRWGLRRPSQDGNGPSSMPRSMHQGLENGLAGRVEVEPPTAAQGAL